MLKLLDQYLLKRFLINLLVGVLTWILIFLVVDVIENISRFIDQHASVHQVVMYYVYYIPYIISLTLPVAMLLAALFSMTSLAQHNEIVAQLSAGISLYRILAPLFILAFLISIGAGIFNETIVPEANQRRWDIRRYDIEKRTRPRYKTRSNIFIQESNNRTISLKYFNGRSNEGRQVSIKTYDGSRLTERIDASRMLWKDGAWLLRQGRVRRFSENGETLTVFKDSLFTNLDVEPEELAIEQKKPEEMGYADLTRFINDLRAIGADPRKWVVEQQLKLSLPFANLIVILLGAPMASRKRRGGMGLNFGISLMISFIYFILIRVGQVLGHQGTLSPFLGAWFGNFVFLALGLYSLFTVRK